VIDNSRKNTFFPATNSGPRPGDFRIGSAASRAAARTLLKARKTAAEQEEEQPPDVRMVLDMPSAKQGPSQNIVERYVSGREIVEIVFPAHAYKGECLGFCSVSPDVSVEEALRELRKRRHDERAGIAALHLP
jgi:hypothetical protein